LPEVLYALGRFHAESGDFKPAVECYEKAIAIEDKSGRVPVVAIEQLANLEARQGEKIKDTALVVRGIKRLRGLLDAADGAGETSVNSERCALLGSAYKRLANLLERWSSDAGTEDQPTGVKQALEQAALWYQQGEGDPNQPGFSPYCAQNRLALQAVLGDTKLEEAALALQAGEIARRRYARSRDLFDLLMVADGVLIARLIDGGLRDRPEEAEREILACYQDIRGQLPESARQLDSVITQIRLLAGFLKQRAAAEPEVEGLATLGNRLRRIVDLLEGKLETAPDRQQSVTPAPLPPDSTAGASEEASPLAGTTAEPARSTAVEDSSGEQPAEPSAKARKKRPE
jgi:tetratricopeptide (TPR) repeat protein